MASKEQRQRALESPFCRKLSKVAESKGYFLRECFYSSEFNEYVVDLVGEAEYAPNIYVDDDLSIRMGTTSYGALEGNEIDEYINDIQNAQVLISYLESLDWGECPDIDYM